MTTQTDSATRTYACEGCECGRVLDVERQPDGTFWLELHDRLFSLGGGMTAAEVLAEIEADGEVVIDQWPDRLSIFLSDTQVADLREFVAP